MNFKSIFIFFFLGIILSASIASGQNINFEWGKGFGGNLADYGDAITVDKENNAYVVGGFTGTADFDPGDDSFKVKTIGLADIYVNKLDASGNFVWARTMGGKGSDRAAAVATDEAGNVYLTGVFGRTADFDPGEDTFNLNALAYTNAFIVKLNGDGELVWAKSIEGTGTGEGHTIKIDQQQNIYIGGSFGGKSDFNPGREAADTFMVEAKGYIDAFVLKLDSLGNFLWVWTAGGEDADIVKNLIVDELGNTYSTGTFWGEVDFDPASGTGMLTSTQESQDGFLLKLDPDGKVLWNRQIKGSSMVEGRGLALHPSGGIYLTGIFMETVNLDTTQKGYLEAYGEAMQLDAFLALMDTSGYFVWGRQIGGVDYDEANAVETDRAGNAYVLGTFKQTAYFTPDTTEISLTMSPMNTREVFLAKYSDTGSLRWVQRYGEIGYNDGQGLCVNASADIHLTGNYAGEIDCDPGINDWHWVKSNGTHDVYAIKLSCADTSSSVMEFVICDDSFSFLGQTFTATGDYQLRIPNVVGCDSTIYFHLDLKEALNKPIISVNGVVLSATQDYFAYQWLVEGVSIPGATNRSYQVMENGNYTVAVSDSSGNCTDTSDVYTVNNANSIKQLGIDIQIYPNPTKEVINIKSPEFVDAIVSTLDGRIILKKENAKMITVAHLSDGVYFLQLKDKEGRTLKTEKITKQ